MSAASWPHTASRRTHARPRLEAATLRVRAVTKVRAYVARLMRRVAARQAPAAPRTARGSSTATVSEKDAMRACCRTRARGERHSCARVQKLRRRRCVGPEPRPIPKLRPSRLDAGRATSMRSASRAIVSPPTSNDSVRSLASVATAGGARHELCEASSGKVTTRYRQIPGFVTRCTAYTPAARANRMRAGALSINEDLLMHPRPTTNETPTILRFSRISGRAIFAPLAHRLLAGDRGKKHGGFRALSSDTE